MMTAPPRVVLKSRRALPFFYRHPWVFAGAIARIDGNLDAGSEVVVTSHSGELIARGLFNPQSNIQVRLYSWDAERPLDRRFWAERIDKAIELRTNLDRDSPQNSAVRLIYSEADGLSGLIVDRYGEWLVVQFTSLALSLKRDLLIELLQEKLQPAGIWLRTEKGIRKARGWC